MLIFAPPPLQISDGSQRIAPIEKLTSLHDRPWRPSPHSNGDPRHGGLRSPGARRPPVRKFRGELRREKDRMAREIGGGGAC
jgi:hypothetical protein